MNWLLNIAPLFLAFITIGACIGLLMAMSQGFHHPRLDGCTSGADLDWTQIDAVNMSSRRYQFEAILSQLALLAGFWILASIVPALIVLVISGFSTEAMLGYIRWEATPRAFFWFGVFILFYQKMIWGYNPENTVRGSVNFFRPLYNSGGTEADLDSNDGGARMRVASQGLFFRKVGDSPGRITDIDRERPYTSAVFTVTVWKVALEIQLILVWLPNINRISRWFQNGKTEAEREKIMEYVSKAAQQAVEEKASKVKDPKETNRILQVLYVIANQSRLIKHALKAAHEEARRYGVKIVSMRFAKCDLPAEVQATLNGSIKADTKKEIAKELKAAGISEGLANVAAVMAETPGAKIEQKLYGLTSDEASLKILEIARENPEALGAVAALILKGKKA